ncbi:hypothetical protein D3C76_1042680 [compost metagenome]
MLGRCHALPHLPRLWFRAGRLHRSDDRPAGAATPRPGVHGSGMAGAGNRPGYSGVDLRQCRDPAAVGQCRNAQRPVPALWRVCRGGGRGPAWRQSKGPLREQQRALRGRGSGPREPAQRHRFRRPAHAPSQWPAGAHEQRVHGHHHPLQCLAPLAGAPACPWPAADCQCHRTGPEHPGGVAAALCGPGVD